jgi:hypothetical protein
MSVLAKPKHQHDCKACSFLGQFVTEGQTLDLYHCEQGGIMPTLLYRHGDKGSEYGTMPPTVYHQIKRDRPDLIPGHPGVAAYKLALKRGLIHEPATV